MPSLGKQRWGSLFSSFSSIQIVRRSVWHTCSSCAPGFILPYSPGEDERLRLQELYCAVELHGSLTRGMSTFDWNKTLERKPNVALVQKVNLRGFNAMMDASTD